MKQQTTLEMRPHLKAQSIMYKLEDHPAIPFSVGITRHLTIDIAQVCENGRTKPQGIDGDVNVYYSKENYAKFKAEFDAELLEEADSIYPMPLRLCSISVPYSKVYGKRWKAHHIEYWGEIAFSVFTGKDLSKVYEQKNWMQCLGIECSGSTYEEVIHRLGSKFLRRYGNFSSSDFLTKAEQKNHATHVPVSFGSTITRNPKYKDVSQAELNRRWVKWFLKTPFGKKHWKETILELETHS